MMIDNKISENKPFILSKDNFFVKYIKRNFNTALTLKNVDSYTIVTPNNCIGIIKKDKQEYRFYSKVGDVLEVFRMMEKITFSKYKFKVNKTFIYFDPREKVKIENGGFILNQLIDIFVIEINKIKNIGLSKKYTINNKNLYYLKGRLDLSKHISKNIVPIKFYCKYNEMTYLTDENIILYMALQKISKSTHTTSIQKSRIITLKNEFPCILNNINYSVLKDKVKYNKTKINSHYDVAIAIAEMIIKGSLYSSLREGDNIFCNFIVSTDILFERYIFLLLNEIISEQYKEFTIKEQVDLNRIEKISKDNKSTGYLIMIPDIVIYKNEVPVLIIDTKYINLYGKTKLTNSVYYQMLSYLICMNNVNSEITPKGILLAFGKEEANSYKLKYDENSTFDIFTRGIDILADEKVVKNQLKLIIEECVNSKFEDKQDSKAIVKEEFDNYEEVVVVAAETKGDYQIR